MKRVYAVVVTSDTENFSEVTTYATFEQAKKGLELALKWTKECVIDYGFEDEMNITVNEKNFTINYSRRENGNGYYDFFYGEIIENTMFEEGDEVLPNKYYKVEVVTTVTYDVLAHTEEEALELYEQQRPVVYDCDKKIEKKVTLE